MMLVLKKGWSSGAILAAALCLLPAAGAIAAPPLAAEGRALAELAFNGVNSRLDRLASLQYKVVRKTRAKGISLTEQWSFYCSTQGWIRIDYTVPEKRVFVVDGQSLLEYLPEARKALRTPLAGGVGQPVAGVLKRLSVDGLRMGNAAELLGHMKSAAPLPGQPAILEVEGESPRYFIRIDTARQVLLQYDQWNPEGEKVLSVLAGDFVEPAPGLWLPSRIQTLAVEKGAVSEREVTLKGIKVNALIPEEYFDLTLPDDVEIETRPGFEALKTKKETTK